MKPEEFERQIARILTTLAERTACVTWNDKFPDPDNPSQMRQVDISVRRDGSLTIVECRLHSRPQDVKWIEELYGRRISLNADAVIGVSASGFTKGAVEKARRLGVFLRTMTELSDREIAAWGQRTQVKMSSIQFDDIVFRVVADDSTVFPAGLSGGILTSSDGGDFKMRDVLSHCATMLTEQSLPEGPFSLHLRLKHIVLGSVPVNEVVFSANWRWSHREVSLPSVLVFSDEANSDAVATFVERDPNSRTEAHHTSADGVMIIDVSAGTAEGSSLLRRITTTFEKSATMSSVVLIGGDETHTATYSLLIERRSSPAYLNFLRALNS